MRATDDKGGTSECPTTVEGIHISRVLALVVERRGRSADDGQVSNHPAAIDGKDERVRVVVERDEVHRDGPEASRLDHKAVVSTSQLRRVGGGNNDGDRVVGGAD